MPHQCLNCGETFREGSVEILEGCPECDGTRFFHTEESLDESEREDLRQETQETVKEAIQEALEDPERDSDVWSWERREEWLRLEPDEAREVLHDVVDDADVVDGDTPLPDAGSLPDGAPDPDEGTKLAFPETGPDPEEGPVPRDEAGETTDETPGEAPEEGDRPEVPAGAEADDGPGPEDEPEAARKRIRARADERPVDEAETNEDGVTPAELANAARPGADEADGNEADTEVETAPEAREPPEPQARDLDPAGDPVAVDPPAGPQEPDPAGQELPDDPPDPAPAATPTETTGGDERVSTVNVEEPGRYDIDVESLLDTNPVIIEKDGHYMVHLPSIFSAVDED